MENRYSILTFNNLNFLLFLKNQPTQILQQKACTGKEIIKAATYMEHLLRKYFLYNGEPTFDVKKYPSTGIQKKFVQSTRYCNISIKQFDAPNTASLKRNIRQIHTQKIIKRLKRNWYYIYIFVFNYNSFQIFNHVIIRTTHIC